jgi:GT2 family glycosyltransferase
VTAASVVVLAFGDEPWLASAVGSALRSDICDLEVVVVDNGTTAGLTRLAESDARVRVVGDGTNLGFAGGVNLGVAHSRGSVIVLLNSDAELLGDSLATLVERAQLPGAGIVGALIALADEPDRINSRGNPLHVLGLSWAGGFGEPVSSAPQAAEVASASGACLALRRELWDALGGFSELYFAYYEDMDLCWRCHQRGLPVSVLADAKVVHHYEFSRNPTKMYLLERNRLLFLLTCYERRTLVAIALPLVGMEVALAAAAAASGWGSEKVRGWRWLLRNRGKVMQLRRGVQARRLVPDSDLYDLLTDTFDTTQLSIPSWTSPLQRAVRGYWAAARRVLATTGRRSA